ncbi:hypothetical protein L0B53_12185 [Vibrio sp. SS-MA-C1-2]|uniref:hypothetical protein n=1 Tax=Vibrio sp. SS-MA-C1-2 TaxID=2908646 RepID=UPI001F3FC483|nr:hypothetical protein [Vibrio sp. SS-MA-C1-2]UJF17785.1 hypothetical protein L0B53_12185 [Vibrio sp. SS-MA-C1-2]
METVVILSCGEIGIVDHLECDSSVDLVNKNVKCWTSAENGKLISTYGKVATVLD